MYTYTGKSGILSHVAAMMPAWCLSLNKNYKLGVLGPNGCNVFGCAIFPKEVVNSKFWRTPHAGSLFITHLQATRLHSGCVYTTTHGQFSVFSPAFLLSFSYVYTIKADPKWSPFVSFSSVYTRAKNPPKFVMCQVLPWKHQSHSSNVWKQAHGNTRHMTKIVKTFFWIVESV